MPTSEEFQYSLSDDEFEQIVRQLRKTYDFSTTTNYIPLDTLCRALPYIHDILGSQAAARHIQRILKAKIAERMGESEKKEDIDVEDWLISHAVEYLNYDELDSFVYASHILTKYSA